MMSQFYRKQKDAFQDFSLLLGGDAYVLNWSSTEGKVTGTHLQIDNFFSSDVILKIKR